MRSTAVSVLAAGLVVVGCDESAPRTAYGSAPTVALNEAVDVGAFTFTVTNVELSQPIGDGLRTVYCQNQILKDLAGKTYENGGTVGAGEVHDTAYLAGATVRVLSPG